MKKFIVFCALFFALNTAVYCAQLSKIELSDGSVINGEIVSYLNGIYTINTTTVGEMKVGSEKISKIESVKSAPSGIPASPILQGNNPNQSQVNAYGQALMQNPENAAVLISLTSNPELQAMASDPEIIEAAKTNNIQALMKNPRFMNMVNSPEMQEAVKKLKK
ncbi:MAG: hypothetical protein WCY09_04855 [Candidatus Omnitrophota bacterium]